MREVKLKSSKKILVNEGKVNENVLISLILEAYKFPNLYAESTVKYKRIDNDEVNICEAPYKELWDCYRNVTGKEDYHPYDKKLCNFSKAKYFVESIKEKINMEKLRVKNHQNV